MRDPKSAIYRFLQPANYIQKFFFAKNLSFFPLQRRVSFEKIGPSDTFNTYCLCCCYLYSNNVQEALAADGIQSFKKNQQRMSEQSNICAYHLFLRIQVHLEPNEAEQQNMAKRFLELESLVTYRSVLLQYLFPKNFQPHLWTILHSFLSENKSMKQIYESII